MPRGFLVKRTNRAAPVSYRVRGADPGPGPAEGPAPRWGPPAPAGSPRAPSRSPDRPAGRPASSSSPVLAESFPGPSAPASSPGGAVFADEEVEMGSSCAPARAVERQPPAAKAKAQGKRPRAERKACRDEVTTSPVLGLRITQGLADCRRPKAPGQPLGEFICQLCKERYADALALAQHRCSRIVRVEYRCAECDKVFSCPANLASHCRWHKPRDSEDGGKGRPGAGARREGRGPCGDPGPGGGPFDCSLCGKRFRRRASLRKHVAAHRPPVLLSGSPKLLRLALAEARPGPQAPYGPRQDVGRRQPPEGRQVVLFQLATVQTGI